MLLFAVRKRRALQQGYWPISLLKMPGRRALVRAGLYAATQLSWKPS
jgi:hypothetical protein